MLTFDEESHTYFWNDDKIVPGVTTILNKVVYNEYHDIYVDTFTGSCIAGAVFREAGDHGTAVHKAIQLDLTCGVDEESLHPDIGNALNQFREWKDEYVKEIISVEEMAYSLKYGYAGTWDLVLELKRKYGGKRSITDIKTGAHDLSGPQTAAYENNYKEKHKYRGSMLRHVLELPKSGDKFKFLPDTNRGDFRFFLNKLAIYNFMRGLN